jgi:hypothetical protein
MITGRIVWRIFGLPLWPFGAAPINALVREWAHRSGRFTEDDLVDRLRRAGL